MSSTYRSRATAEDASATSVRTDYRCAANGCPNMGGIGGRYGVNRSGTCYFHYREEPKDWPEVTRRILSDDRMLDPTYSDPKVVPDKRKDGPKAWAHALKAREEARDPNDRLTQAQKDMWRQALRVSLPESTE